MNWLAYALLVAAPSGLLALGAVPSSWFNRHLPTTRRAVMGLALAAFLAPFLAITVLAIAGLREGGLLETGASASSGGVLADSLTFVMLLLVSSIGCLITRFSLRYLDGDNTQGRFLRWIGFTLGAVLWLVLAGNLLLFTFAWMLTSFGLHQLLTHYRDRPAAILAARKKFLISRLGDAMLLIALALTYLQFGSWEFAELFAAAAEVSRGGQSGGWLVSLIGILYVMGAMTKSAQFPLHSWLPDTMETPTPVSALMHAGIINAGGFLVIRLSPLVSLSHVAMELLAAVGAVTALFGATVMLTQTSVKRGLAYSTIAQMGFMMLQCGLGNFAAALLHLVAHSLYKAHAFLSSGSVLDRAAAFQMDAPEPATPRQTWGSLFAALILASSIGAGVAWAFGVTPREKPGALLFGWILVLALAQLLWKPLLHRQWLVTATAGVAAAVVSAAYYTAYGMTDRLWQLSASHSVVELNGFDALMMGFVAAGFTAMLLLQVALAQDMANDRLRALYVHASNGFYLDITSQQLTVRVWRRFLSNQEG